MATTSTPVPKTRAGVLAILKTYPGTVTATWVQENPSLKPYQGMTAVQMYEAIEKQTTGNTPLQIGQAVNAVWIGGGLAGAVKKIIVAGGTAMGAVATGTATGLSGGSTTGCLWNLPIVGCVMTTTEARALVAGLLMGAAGFLALVSLVLIGTGAGAASGVTGAAGGALEGVGAGIAFVPGLEGAGLAVGAVGAGAKRASSNSGARQSLNRRQGQRDTAARQAEAQQQEQGTP